MKKRNVRYFYGILLTMIVSLSLYSPFVVADALSPDEQPVIIPANKIRPGVSANFDGSVYRYKLENFVGSEQKIWRWMVILSDATLAESVTGPTEWWSRLRQKGRGWRPEIAAVAWASWGGPVNVHIPAGATVNGFEIVSSNPPGIVDFYAEGDAPPPRFPGFSAPEGPIPGYDDLTAYGPGVVGRTLGPVEPPRNLIPAVFTEYLLESMREATSLGWLRNQGLVRSIEAKLTNARAAFVRGNDGAGLNLLRALQNELEAQKGKGVSEEGYALLVYNYRYFIGKLEASAP